MYDVCAHVRVCPHGVPEACGIEMLNIPKEPSRDAGVTRAQFPIGHNDRGCGREEDRNHKGSEPHREESRDRGGERHED